MTEGHYRDAEYRHNRTTLIRRAWRLRENCWLCGQPFKAKGDITADHKRPLCQGGTHALDNLAPAHKSCNNNRDHSKDIDDSCEWSSEETA